LLTDPQGKGRFKQAARLRVTTQGDRRGGVDPEAGGRPSEPPAYPAEGTAARPAAAHAPSRCSR